MKWKSDGEGRRWSNVLKVASVLVLGVVSARAVSAQTATAESGPADVKTSGEAYQTFYLTSLTEPKEANDVVNDLRNMLPRRAFTILHRRARFRCAARQKMSH
ncbi:MAG: hypothetical protein WB679_15160 [Terracidiphilus sp.]